MKPRLTTVLLSALVAACLLVFQPRLANTNLPKELVWWSLLPVVTGIALLRASGRDLAEWRERLRGFARGPLLLAVVLWIAWLTWWCVSATRSPDSVAGWIGVARFAGYGVTFLVFAMLDARDRRWLAAVVAITCAAVSAVALLQWANVSLLSDTWQTRPSATMGNPNFAADCLAALLPMCIAWAFSLGRPWRWWVATLGTALIVAAIVATGSRAGILALLCGIAAAAPLWLSRIGLARLVPKSRAKRLLLTVGGITALIGVAISIIALASALPRLGRAETIRLRGRMWERSLVLARERPVAGWGAGAYRVAMEPQKVWIEPVGGDRFPEHAHSWLVEALVEQGIVGVALMLATWGALAWVFLLTWRRRRNETGSRLSAGAYFVGACALLGGTLVGVWLNWWGGAWLLWMLLGLAIGSTLDDPSPAASESQHAPIFARIAGLLLLLLGIALAWFAAEFYTASRLDFEAKRHIDRREIAKARALLDQAFRHWPRPRTVWFHATEARYHTGDYASAAEALDHYETLAPRTSDLLVLRASILLKTGRTADALALLSQAREREPSGDKAIVMARVLLELGRRDEAERVLRAQLQRMVYAPLVEFYAEGAKATGRAREGLDFIAALADAPGAKERDSRAGLALAEGRLALSLGRAARAADAFQRAIQGPPGARYSVWNDYASALWRDGRLDAADTAFAHAIEIAPLRFEAPLNRLQLAIQRRDLPLARQLLAALSNRPLPDPARRRVETIRRALSQGGKPGGRP